MQPLPKDKVKHHAQVETPHRVLGVETRRPVAKEKTETEHLESVVPLLVAPPT